LSEESHIKYDYGYDNPSQQHPTQPTHSRTQPTAASSERRPSAPTSQQTIEACSGFFSSPLDSHHLTPGLHPSSYERSPLRSPQRTPRTDGRTPLLSLVSEAERHHSSWS
jgi:hypothetical protein